MYVFFPCFKGLLVNEGQIATRGFAFCGIIIISPMNNEVVVHQNTIAFRELRNKYVFIIRARD